jgi:NAD(P)-dependent dehydrogenase (short-subunit alcohol dehydrogenase family)
MSSTVTRRQLILGTGAAAGTAVLAACGGTPEDRPPGVPVGPFGWKSTAEEVTEGLDLTGRTALVTGANSGLGYETMRVLALRGAHVIGTARTLEKAREACASIPTDRGRTTPLALELTDFPGIVAAAGQVRAMNLPLDMLICNAGVMEIPTLEQVYGLEKHFVTNHLGHFILTLQLLPQLRAAPQGRIVMVASNQAIRNAPEAGIELDNLSGDRDYDPGRAYGQSKLANMLFARELARRLGEGSTVTINALTPGVIMTNLGRYLPWYELLTARLFGWAFMKSLEAGAATQVYVATAPALEGVSGHIFRDCNPARVGGHSENDDLAARLWDVSVELTRPYLPDPVI